MSANSESMPGVLTFLFSARTSSRQKVSAGRTLHPYELPLDSGAKGSPTAGPCAGAPPSAGRLLYGPDVVAARWPVAAHHVGHAGNTVAVVRGRASGRATRSGRDRLRYRDRPGP